MDAGPDGTQTGLTDEQREVEALRARVAELEARLHEQAYGGAPGEPPAAPPRTGRARSTLAAVLVVLACVLAPLSVVSVWASRVVSDTDQYVNTVAPLADDPGVQAAVADEVSTAVLQQIDLNRVTNKALAALADNRDLPPAVVAALPSLKGPLVDGVQGFTRDQVEKVLATPQFAQVWEQVNRLAHQQVVDLLEGNQGGAVSAQGNTVTLNLAPVVAQVREQLVAQGFTLAKQVPTVDRSFVLVQSDSVSHLQTGYRLLNALGTWLPVLALALLAAGIALARERRRTLVRGTLGVAGAMIVLGVALALARSWYVGHVPGGVLDAPTAGRVFDTLVRFLRSSLRAVGVLALVIALAAVLVGPSSGAVAARRGVSRGIAALRTGAEGAGWRTGPVGPWTWAHRRALRIAAAMLGGVVLIFWNQPTAGVVVVIALLVLLALAVVEFLGRPTPRPPHPA